MGTWYLGPVGSLAEIRAPAKDLEVSPEFVGTVHRSLGGAPTVDRVAQPRKWPLSWQALTEDQATYLRLVGQGLVPGPLRLLDPELRNRLPVQIASGGSYKRSAAGFTQSGGSDPAYQAFTDPPATVPVRGAVSWTRTGTGAASLTTAAASSRVPLIPSEQVRVSTWARGTAIQVSIGYDAWNAAGTADRTLSGTTTLNVSTWTYLDLTYTPPADRISLSPVLDVASGQAASTTQTTGWQVAPASAPTTWAPGGGAPTVVAGSELTETYLLPGLREFGLLLLEVP